VSCPDIRPLSELIAVSNAGRVEAFVLMADDIDPEPTLVPEWVEVHGITDRPSGINVAKSSRQLLVNAAADALGRGQELTPAVVLVGGLVTRGIGLHDGAIAALEADNPFAAFTVIRSYAENAAALLYAVDHPDKINRVLGLDCKPVSIGQLVAHANNSRRIAFKPIYSELSHYAHPGSKSIAASMVVNGDKFRWSATPAFRPGNDFLMASAWTFELAGANSELIVEFANSQGW
jgi:hypothetical protein